MQEEKMRRDICQHLRIGQILQRGRAQYNHDSEGEEQNDAGDGEVPLLEHPHLLDRNLTQRAVRRKGQEIGMRREQQRIVVAFIGRPFFAVGR